MIFPDDFVNKIVCGVCEDVMKQIPDNSVDLIVTSPPYNLKNTSGGGFTGTKNSGMWKSSKLIEGYDVHDDNMPHEEYVKWQRNCLTEMLRIWPFS